MSLVNPKAEAPPTTGSHPPFNQAFSIISPASSSTLTLSKLHKVALKLNPPAHLDPC